MPHMAPMNWLTLFLMFCIIFLMFNSVNYFVVSYKPCLKTSKINQISFNWKW